MAKKKAKGKETCDLVPVKVVQKAESDAARLVAASETLEIIDPNGEETAYRTLKQIKDALKTIEDKRKEITQPLNASLKAANAMFKRLSQPFKDADGAIRDKILAFRKAEQERSEKKNVVREKIQAAHEARGHETHELEKVEAEVAKDTVIVKRWTFRVLSKKLVPRAYLTVNEVAVRAAIRDGVREIKGIEIYQEEGVRA